MNGLINRVRQKFFPSKFETMVAQWYQADGDKKLRLDYDLNDKSLVLDFGGYEGQWASDIFSKYECNIIVFEPVHFFSDSIRQRFTLNNKIEVCQYGLGSSSRTETIHVSANGSSTFGKSSETQSIQILDIKDWIEKRNITKIDLIKINIEGGEYELLERLLDSNLIEIVENIQVQFHDISDDSRRRMNEIQKGLMKTHKLTYQYEFVWENWTKKD